MNRIELTPGIRVRHSSQGYEGWIDDNPFTATNLCRVRVHGRRSRELVPETEIICCNDTQIVFQSTEGLLRKEIESGSDDRETNERLRHWRDLLPLPYTIWALRRYDPSDGGDPIKLLKDADISSEHTSYAIDIFLPQLENILKFGIPIAIVPSHSALEFNPALLGLVRRLVQMGHVDATSTLSRSQSIESSRFSANGVVARTDIMRHLESIEVNDAGNLDRKVVLLLDDVVTSGTTFTACRKLLLDAGAAEVVCLALGWAKRPIPRRTRLRRLI